MDKQENKDIQDIEEVEMELPSVGNQHSQVVEVEEDDNGSLEDLLVSEETEQERPSELRWSVEEIRQIPLEEVDVSLPGNRQRELIERMSQMPLEDKDFESQAQFLYSQSLQQAALNRTKNDAFFRPLFTERAPNWTQGFQIDGSDVSPKRPRFKESGVKATGEEALMRVRSLLGQGGPLVIPLYHSGFWVTLRCPSEEEILTFHNRVTAEKVWLGRRLHSAVLANESVYFTQAVLDFALSCVVSTSLQEGKDAIMDNLNVLDIQHLAWGLAATIYQRGFHFARPVITDNESDYVLQTGLVHVAKMQFVDATLLTDKQKRILAKPTAKVSKEALQVYHDERKVGRDKEVRLSDDVKVVLAVPTATQHITSGLVWVDSIVETIDGAFTYSSQKERNNYIERQSRATMMRQFDHWVKSISFRHVKPSGEESWETYERDEEMTVELLLNELSGQDEVRQVFFNAVRDYMDESVVALIATTVASEKEEEMNKGRRFAQLFPIDACAVFLQLLTRRVNLVDRRDQY